MTAQQQMHFINLGPEEKHTSTDLWNIRLTTADHISIFRHECFMKNGKNEEKEKEIERKREKTS